MSYSVEYIENEDDPYDYSTTLVIEDDDGKREYWDGGEPEDQTFHRDWDWVADELIKAYHQGVNDATIDVTLTKRTKG